MLYELAISIFGLFVWQHVGRVNGWKIRPSLFLDYLACGAEYIWTKVGYFLVWLSSFYHFLYFYSQELAVTIYELVIPVFRIVSSPCYMMYGFMTSVSSYTKPHLIFAGLFLLTLTSMGSMHYYFPQYYPEWAEIFRHISTETWSVIISVFGIYVLILLYTNGSLIYVWLLTFWNMFGPLNFLPEQKPKRRSIRRKIDKPDNFVLNSDVDEVVISDQH